MSNRIKCCGGELFRAVRCLPRRLSFLQLFFYFFVLAYLYLFLVTARNDPSFMERSRRYATVEEAGSEQYDSGEVARRAERAAGDVGLLGSIMSAVSNRLAGSSEIIHVAMASCSGVGEEEFHMREARTFLKSLFLFNPNNIHIHIFATPTNKAYLRRMLNDWKRDTYLNFEATYYDTIFPNVTFKAPVYKNKNEEVPQEVAWENLFRPCSSQRIFIPWGVKQLEKVIYLDADALILGPLDEMWRLFDNFDEHQFLGLAPIAFHHISFTLKRKIPTVGKYGHNAGVALMHAERIRRVDWREDLFALGQKIRETVNVLGDQDMINYYMHDHPEAFYEISCKYNFRREYCIPYRGDPHECTDAKDGGTVLLHGVADTFISNETIFRYVFQAFERFEWGMSIEKDLVELIRFVFVMFEEESCGNVGDIMYRKMSDYIRSHKSLDVLGKVPIGTGARGGNMFS